MGEHTTDRDSKAECSGITAENSKARFVGNSGVVYSLAMEADIRVDACPVRDRTSSHGMGTANAEVKQQNQTEDQKEGRTKKKGVSGESALAA